MYSGDSRMWRPVTRSLRSQPVPVNGRPIFVHHFRLLFDVAESKNLTVLSYCDSRQELGEWSLAVKWYFLLSRWTFWPNVWCRWFSLPSILFAQSVHQLKFVNVSFIRILPFKILTFIGFGGLTSRNNFFLTIVRAAIVYVFKPFSIMTCWMDHLELKVGSPKQWLY